MDIKVNDCVKLQHVILQMYNPYCELAIICLCAIICKINNVIRMHPTKFVSINKFDNSSRKSQICQSR